MATSDRLEQMVGDLVQIVETAKAVPMSASCVINRAEVLEILHELAAGVSEELAESRRLVAERDDVIAQARRDAAEHIEAARRERGSMLSGTEMGREAERIRGAALEEARRIRDEADNYVDDKLANFEVVLTKTLQAVGRGRAKMAGRDPMEELGMHVAEQDAADAAIRPDYEYDERDDHVGGGYQHEAPGRGDYNTGEYPQYSDEAYEAQQGGYQAEEAAYQPEPVYQDAGAGYQADNGYGDYALPEPELSREFAAADMSGVFQRPDFSQDYPPQEYQQQPAPVAVGYNYEEQNGYAANYADPAAVPYPVQPYGAQYGQQEYGSGEYQAYQQPEDPYAQQAHQAHPGHQAQPPEASGFFDTGMIDVRQYRDDPYQQR